ncbi:MAG: sigma-54-dependent Fis family transcriptional regulator [Bacteroidia bacterium]|nr:sigma-54-dependent Fis family transcriptional regulator [Bacteroidia bacterium]
MNSIKVFLVGEDVERNNRVASQISSITNVDFEIFQNGKECIENLALSPSLIFIDYYLSDPGFDQVMRELSSCEPKPKVIIMAGVNERDIANELIREDVHDVVVKDSSFNEQILQAILKQKGKRPTTFGTSPKIQRVPEVNNFIGNSPSMQPVIHAMELFSQNDNVVWIYGKKSTGKESVARNIHTNSKNANSAFIKVDVEHIPADHLRSALFGIGKVNGDQSYFDRCEGGTIYIENVDKLSRENQMHLLSAIGKHSIYDEINAKNINIRSRIIVSTSLDLEQVVRSGNFHESLYKILFANQIALPELSKRGNDVVHLAQKLLNDYSKRNNSATIKLSQDSCLKLSEYSYPGNLTELRSVIEFAAVLAENNVINEDAIVFNNQNEQLSWINQELTLEEFNSKLIHHYLNKYDNKVKLVADKLAIGKSTIYRMLQKESSSDESNE